MPPNNDPSDKPRQHVNQSEVSSSADLANELENITAHESEHDRPPKVQIIKMGRDIATTIYENPPAETGKIFTEIQADPENNLELKLIDLLGSIESLPKLQTDIDQAIDRDTSRDKKVAVLKITKEIRDFILEYGSDVGMKELTDWMTKAALPGSADAVRYRPGLYKKMNEFVAGIIRGIAGELAIGRLFSDRTGAHHQVDLASAEQDLKGTDIIIHSISQPDKSVEVDIKTQPAVTDSRSHDNAQEVPVGQAICRRDDKTRRNQIWIHPDSLADDFQIHPWYEDRIYGSIISTHDVLL